MNVYIDGSFFDTRITGVQRYAREITKELDKLITKGDDYSIVVPDINAVDFNYLNINVVEYHGLFKGYLWDLISFPRYVRTHNGLAVNLCNRPTVGAKGITCLHDIIFRSESIFASKTIKGVIRSIWNRFNYFLITRFSNQIITVSNFTTNEIQHYYKHIKSKTIDIVSSAWQHILSVTEDDSIFKKHSFLVQGNYYYSLSSVEKNKNFRWVINAAINNPSEEFVIAGKGDINAIVRDVDIGNIKNLHFLGYVSDGESKALMHNCKAFLFPSLYEGFGLPPLEAIASGASAIVVSDIPVMHEVYSSYAIYIVGDAMLPQATALMSCNYMDLLNKYSWEQSAKKMNYIIKANV